MGDTSQLDEEAEYFARWEENREWYLRFLLCIIYIIIVGILLFILFAVFGHGF